MASRKEAQKEETALATVAPSQIVTTDYGDDAGQGYGGQTALDTVPPWIYLSQSNSPQVTDSERAVPVRAGQWYLQIADTAWDLKTGFLFVPATTRHVYAEWTPRDEGGGYHGEHAINSKVVTDALAEMKRFGKLFVRATEYDKHDQPVEKTHQLTETHYVYGVVVDEAGYVEGPGVLSFKSTHIRPYRAWQSRIQRVRDAAGRRPPLFAHLTRFTSFKDKNDQGEFYVPVIEPARGDVLSSLLSPTDAAYQAAREYKTLVESGAVKADFSKENRTDDVPF
jgi:hypothetical protein